MPQPLTSTLPRVAMLATIALAAPALRAEVVDRVAAIVGREAITLSQVSTQLHVVAMLNQTEPDSLEAGGEAALRSLVDRSLAMQDLALTPFLLASEEDVEGPLQDLRQRTFAGGRDFASALAHYSLAEDDCRTFLREQVSFERYVSFRFRTGQEVSPEAVDAYYRDEYSPRQAERGAPLAPLESVRPQITEVIAERQANALLEQRILELRALTHIEILAFADLGGEQ